MSNQRLADLVRHQRIALFNADLITEDEYTELAQDHAAVARLEDYDRLRAALDAQGEEVKKLEKSVGELFLELEGVNPGRVTARDNRILELEAVNLRMCKEVAVRDAAIEVAGEGLREIAFHVPTCTTLGTVRVVNIDEVFSLKKIAGDARSALAALAAAKEGK